MRGVIVEPSYAVVYAILGIVGFFAALLGITLKKWSLLFVSILLSALWLWFMFDVAAEFSGENFYGVMAGAITLNVFFLLVAWITRFFAWLVWGRKKKEDKPSPHA